MIRIFLFVVLLLGVAPAYAADPALPQALKEFAKGGAVFQFLGRTHGYDGWVGVKDGHEEYFYVAPDGSHFYMGVLFDKTGHAITGDQLKKIQAKDDAPSDLSKKGTAPDSLAEAMWADLGAAKSVTVGADASPVFYLYIDPTDAAAKQTVDTLAPAIQAGAIQVKMILMTDTKDAAVVRDVGALLAMTDAARVVFDYMLGDRTVVAKAPKVNTQDLENNQNLAKKWRFQPGPVTIYRAKDGTIKMVEGMVTDARSLLQDLL